MFLYKPAFLLFLIGCCLILSPAEAQNACDNVTAFPAITCAQYEVAVGTQADLGETYTWYKGAERVRGPLSGNGSAISFNFRLNNPGDAGIYTIERSGPGSPTTCANKIEAIYVPLPDSQQLISSSYNCASGGTIITIQNSQVGVTYYLWNQYRYIDAYPGTGSPIEMYVYDEATYYVNAYYDNTCPGSYVRFGNISTRAAPEPLQLVSCTPSSATFQWPGTGNYLLEYGPVGFTPGTGATAGINGTILNASQPGATINGLAAGTNYSIYVRVKCNADDYSLNTVTYNFSTTCPGNNAVPFSEGFETTANGPLYPSCWTRLPYAISATSYGGVSDYAARTGAKCLVLQSADSSCILLPKINSTGNLRLRYFANVFYGPAIYEIRVSNGSNLLSAFNTVLKRDTIYTTNGYIQKDLSLNHVTGTTVIAFKTILGSILVDDVTIQTTPACAGPFSPGLTGVGNNSAQLNWTGSGSFIVEYGLAGFTPGTAATAGVGGTIFTTTNNSLTINSLAANTAYDAYIRQNCTASSGGYSINSNKINFTTFFNCASAINISNCTNTVANMAAGTGTFSFDGFYPNNSCGQQNFGKELLYGFTPAVSGVYYLNVLSYTGNAVIDHFYKPAAAGCGNTGWIGIHSAYQGRQGYVAIGALTAATPYYFLFKNVGTNACTQTFKICRAEVVASNFCNDISLKNEVPAGSTKKEYLLDDFGNLVAELDFSQVITHLRNPTYNTVNKGRIITQTAAVRHDLSNKEYLDRDFSFTAADSIKGALGIKFYFRNTELTRLINEPDDGIADVTGIAGLIASSFVSETCVPIAGTGKVRMQQGNGVYDANSSYVQYSHPVSAKSMAMYFHGGNAALHGDTSSTIIADICPGGSAFFTIPDPGPAFIYQWQVNNGTGYTNVTNDSIYSGSLSRSLSINNPRTSLYGYKYRCILTNGSSSIAGREHILKFSLYWTGQEDSDWRNPDNWNCYYNYATPDANTDVYINNVSQRMPVIFSNVSCRSLTVSDGANVEVQNNAVITITGKQ